MQGRDLAVVLDDDQRIRSGALFGIHGGHVNVTDGRYVYMRATIDPSDELLEEYTLMPTHMRSRFSVADLSSWEPAPPFTFTKGLRTMRLPAARSRNSWRHGTLLFDLHEDPGQERPLVDDELELRMLRLLAELMHDSDAPPSQFARLGIPSDSAIGPQHLLVRVQADRAAAAAEPLPALADLPAADLLVTPIHALLSDHRVRGVLEQHTPDLVHTELVAASARLTLLDLARTASISAAALRSLAEDLATATSATAGP